MPSAVQTLSLQKDLERHLALGHPWVYRSALRAPRAWPAAGEVVDVVDRRGRPAARGWFDPDGPIAFRALSHPLASTAATEAPAPIDDAWIARRIGSACALRRVAASVGKLDGDAVRLVHGEGDFAAGLVVDLYASTAVVRFDGPAARAFWRPRMGAVLGAIRGAGFPVERAWARGARAERGGGGEALEGGEPTGVVEIREGGARYEVDVVHGQKTGFFLDQRDNRRLVGRLAAGAQVLNLFGYTGGFSVAAALGGARRVTTVDLARPAIDAARRHLALNGVDPARHELIAADAFAFLDEAIAAGRRWDIVVCDPPSFAPSEKAKPQAIAAYRRLNRAAMDVVAPGALLATASCSSHVSPAEFAQVIADAAADAGRSARLLDVRAAGVDHPVLPAFPEGRYLKFLLVQLG